MAFDDSNRFPDRIARGMVGGPEYDVTITEVESGIEYRNLNQPYSKGDYEAGIAVRTKADYDEVHQHFHVVGGPFCGFRFKDYFDFEVVAAESVLTLITGETEKYQAFKQYAGGSSTRLRKLQKLVANTQHVYDVGGELMAGWTVDVNTGIFTITSGTAPYTFVSEYDVPVRYGIKKMQTAHVSGTGSRMLVKWQSIPLREIRRPE